MGGTGPGRPMRIIFGSVIWSWNTSLNIKFGHSFDSLSLSADIVATSFATKSSGYKEIMC